MKATTAGDLLFAITVGSVVTALAVAVAGLASGRLHPEVLAVAAGFAVWGNAILMAWGLADCLSRDWGDNVQLKTRWLFWLLLLWPSVWWYYLRVMRPARVRRRR